jgi:hypothetical protein
MPEVGRDSVRKLHYRALQKALAIFYSDATVRRMGTEITLALKPRTGRANSPTS